MTPSRPGALLFAIAFLGTIVATACGAATTNPSAITWHASVPIEAMPAAIAADGQASESPTATRDDETPRTPSACNAPSVVRLYAAEETLDPNAPSACSPDDAWTQTVRVEQAAAARCDVDGRRVDLARLLEGALPLDDDTTEHVRRIFREGQARGRRRDAFGLVGDSMTVAWNFLAPFAPRGMDSVVPEEVERVLALASRLDGVSNVLALFRGVGRRPGSKNFGLDPFVAPRAAKVGVRATWPLAPRGPQQPSPLAEMVSTVSPAYAVVLYGANDAVWHADSMDTLVQDFSSALSAIVDALESRGVVPVLTTVPEHRRALGWPDCASLPGGPSNERFAVQATALSAAVADVACRRHLPLIDLRWSLEPLINSGIGPDGIHLSAHRKGGGILDASGLQCGYNVRNLVTLRELALVVDAISKEVHGEGR